jgi:O-antigen/teichoic acid export membrane protein
MLRSLFRNVAVSAAAFFAVSVIGLLLVPVLISSFGVAGFGTIVLGRLFFPTSGLGVLDFGFGEITTNAVARARVDGDWARASRMVRLAIVSTAGVGGAAAVAMLLASPWLPAWLRLAPADHAAFSWVLRLTALALPLLFMSLVAEGVVKGFERFSALRALEVAAALSHAAIILAVVAAGGSPIAACYALVVSLTFRALLSAILSVGCLRSHWIRPDRSEPDERAWFFTMTRSMAVNKQLGTAQTQLAPLLIGLLLGPLGAGTYDALNRLPRAIKAVLGLLSSTVLPVASRLESAADTKGMRRLGHAGVLVTGIVALPPVAASMVYSEPLLRLWIGEEFSHMWVWQSLMFAIPAMSVLLSFSGTALLVRPSAMSAMNRLTILQVLLQFTLALLAVRWLNERAFILGQVFAAAVTFVPQMRLVSNELGIEGAVYRRLLRLVAALVSLAAMAWWFGALIDTWLLLGLAMSLLTLAGWASGLLFGLSPHQRARVFGETRSWIKRITEGR